MDNFTFEMLLCAVGMLMGTTAQILIFVYMIAAARGVSLPNYSDFRVNANISFLFAMLMMSFLRLSMPDTAGPVCGALLVLHLLLWILLLVVGIIMLAASRYQRDRLKSGVSAIVFKLLLTTLTLWVVI